MKDGSRKYSIVFIVNPISGIGKQRVIETAVADHLDSTRFEHSIVYTKHRGHAIEIAREYVEKGTDIIVAVGGDGSVNEVASSVANSKSILAIIPTGSGNGLARHLAIPLNIADAIRTINELQVITIDTATLNKHFFLSIAGIGFDAYVAKRFAGNSKRGFMTYIKIAATSYFNYKPNKYRLIFKDKEILCKALFISIANANQFGNNTIIAPTADLSDGLLDICIFRKIPVLKTPFYAPLLFSKMIDRSKYMDIIKTDELTIIPKRRCWIHIDGEPLNKETTLHIKINKSSLNIIVPTK